MNQIEKNDYVIVPLTYFRCKGVSYIVKNYDNLLRLAFLIAFYVPTDNCSF